MSIETIVDTMLGHPAVVAIVGGRYALGALQEAEYPAITYRIVTNMDQQNLAAHKANQLKMARVQVNLHAIKQTEVITMREAVRAAMHNVYARNVAGHRVVSCAMVLATQPDRDDALGVWSQAVDFAVRYY